MAIAASTDWGTMTSLTSLLIDIDAVAPAHPALEQAIGLAVRAGARVKIVDVLPLVPPGARQFVTADIEQELVVHRRERLAAIAEAVQDVSVTTELLRGRPSTALVREVLQSRHDLLVRSHGRDHAEGPTTFGAIDMELLRQCPCPVWLAGRRISPHPRWRLVAAINPNPNDATEQQLNERVVEWALLLRDFIGADLTLLHAWTLFGGSVLRSRLPREEFLEYGVCTRRAAHDAMAQFAEPLADRLTGVTIQLVEGEPAPAILHFVEANDIDLVVMGTVARTGIAGLVMGNTAERLLRRLRSSVIALKPPGFKSPVLDA